MTSLPVPSPFWLVGCGNMAGAMLRRWLEIGADPRAFTAIRPSGAAVAEGVRVVQEIPSERAPRIVLLGVKPQKLDEVAPPLAPLMAQDTLILSILAGVTMAQLRDRFPTGIIARAMPNLPVALGVGTVALALERSDEAARSQLDGLMAPLGTAAWIDEALFDLVTALVGSGPAFLYRFIDALAEAGTALGLPPEQAERLALSTVEGAAALAAASDRSPAALARAVASPGGTTQAGLNVLDDGDALRALVRATLEAARDRGRQLAEQAGRAGPPRT